MTIDKAQSALELSAAFGYLTEAEVSGLIYLVQQLPPNPLVVNIGAGAGTSAVAIFEARDDVRLTTVDARFEDSPLGSIQSERKALIDAGHLPGRVNTYRAIHGDSRAVGMNWDLGPIDMVFVDDGHMEPEIEGDIRSWVQHIIPGGFIVVDDYVPVGGSSAKPRGKVWPDVAKVCDDLLGEYTVIMQIDTVRAWVVESTGAPTAR